MLASRASLRSSLCYGACFVRVRRAASPFQSAGRRSCSALRACAGVRLPSFRSLRSRERQEPHRATLFPSRLTRSLRSLVRPSRGFATRPRWPSARSAVRANRPCKFTKIGPCLDAGKGVSQCLSTDPDAGVESPRPSRSRVTPLPARIEVSLRSTSRRTLSRISSLALG